MSFSRRVDGYRIVWDYIFLFVFIFVFQALWFFKTFEKSWVTFSCRSNWLMSANDFYLSFSQIVIQHFNFLFSLILGDFQSFFYLDGIQNYKAIISATKRAKIGQVTSSDATVWKFKAISDCVIFCDSPFISRTILHIHKWKPYFRVHQNTTI